MEDDADALRLLAGAAAEAGFEVLQARTAAEAESQFGARPADGVILDITLPDASGFELAAKLRRKPWGDRFALVLVSGVVKAARHRDDAAEQLDAADLLEKPVAPADVLARLREALDARAARFSPPTATPREFPTTSPSGIHFVSSSTRESFVAATRLTPGRRLDLASHPFFRVFARLSREGYTGLANLRQGRVRKVVTFRAGRPVGVKSNLVSECLGRVMVEAGLLEESQCEESVTRMKETGERQGQALLELGWASRRSLDYALQLQLERKLFDTFGWTEGECTLAEDTSGPDGAAWDVPLDMTPLEAVHEGLARTWTTARFEAALPERTLAVKPLELPDVVALGEHAPELAATCALVNGLRSVGDLLEAGTLPTDRAAALLLALDALGQVTFAPRAAEEEVVLLVKRSRRPVAPLAAPPARPPDRAEAALLEQLEAHLSDLSRRTHYEVLGLPREAAAEAIRQAWLQLGRDFHPDRWAARATPAVRVVAERIFDRIAEAHALLADPVERRRYDAALDARASETDAERAERILKSDESFRKGRAALASGHSAEAETAFAEAHRLYPEDALFLAYLGLASFHADHGADAAGRALTHLRHSRELAPRLPEAHLFEATVRQALGEEARAAEELARAEALLAAVRPPPDPMHG